MNKEKMINRIKGILNKADGNANEHEAQVAISTAQRLMLKHNIEMFEVERFEDAEFKNPELNIRLGSEIEYSTKMIVPILETYFFVRVIIHEVKYVDQSVGCMMEIYGRRHNAEVARHMFLYLKKMYQQMFDQYQENNKPMDTPFGFASVSPNWFFDQASPTFENDYYFGLTMKLQERLHIQRIDDEAEAQASYKDAWGLVAIDNEKLNDAMTAAFPELEVTETSHRDVRNRMASQAGYNDGLLIPLNESIESPTGK